MDNFIRWVKSLNPWLVLPFNLINVLVVILVFYDGFGFNLVVSLTLSIVFVISTVILGYGRQQPRAKK